MKRHSIEFYKRLFVIFVTLLVLSMISQIILAVLSALNIGDLPVRIALCVNIFVVIILCICTLYTQSKFKKD